MVIKPPHNGCELLECLSSCKGPFLMNQAVQKKRFQYEITGQTLVLRL